jgi:probable phosphoglycerate mutase
MRLFIIRHADPDYPNNTITPAGHLEAQALAVRMKRLGLDRIYSSPLGRAVDTMRYTADALEMPHTIEDWTAELSDCGVTVEPWGKMSIWDVPAEHIRENGSRPTHENWHTFRHFDTPSIRVTHERVRRDSDAFLARHGYEHVEGRYRIVRGNRDKIAVFCHGGFGLFWLSHLLELPLPMVCGGFFLPPSSVTTILFDERTSDWAVPRCVGMGDVSHLYAAGLPVQPAGIKANVD